MMVAAFRDRATHRPDPLIHDPFAGQVCEPEGYAVADSFEGQWAACELYVALRTAYLDAQIAQWVARGRVGQVVLLGAGLDMRAWRLDEARDIPFFEVDAPASQAYKRERVGTLTLPTDRPGPTYVSCNFERDDFMDRLCESGLDLNVPAFFVWEGVTMYLTDEAVAATLARIGQRAEPRSLLCFDFVGKRMATGDRLRAHNIESRELVEQLNEPMRWGTNHVVPMLAHAGFRFTRVVTFDQLALHFTGSYDRSREFRFQSMALASVDAPELV